MKKLVLTLSILFSICQIQAEKVLYDQSKPDSVRISQFLEMLDTIQEDQLPAYLPDLENAEQIAQKAELWNLLSVTYAAKAGIYFNLFQPDSAIHYYRLNLDIIQKNELTESFGWAYYKLCLAFFRNGLTDSAEYYGYTALANQDTAWSIAIPFGIHELLGTSQLNQSNYIKAIEHYSKAIELSTGGDLHQQHLLSTNNLGIVYMEISDTQRALQQYQQTLKLATEQNEVWWMATALLNCALINQMMGQFAQADSLISIGDSFYQSIDDKVGEMFIAGVKGDLANSQNRYDDALKWYLLYDQLSSEHYNSGYEEAKLNLAKVYQKMGKCEISLENAQLALELAKERKLNILFGDIYEVMYKCYKFQGNYKQALLSHEKFKQHQDSTKRLDNQKAIIRQQIDYEQSQKAFQDSIQQVKKQAIILEKKSRRDRIQYSGILLFVILVGSLIALSGKMQMAPKFANVLIFVFFILLFEFFLLLLDPLIDQWSNGIILTKMGMNSVIALALSVAHYNFETRLKKVMVKKQY